jgi:plastocyanin
MRLVSLVTLVLLAGASGCGGSSGYGSSTGPGGGGGGGHTLSISMTGSAFSPALDTVAAGSTVTWTNNDAVTHTVTSAPGSADTYSSGNVGGSGTFQHMFAAAGTYVYYCTIHGTPTAGMKATIVVQ